MTAEPARSSSAGADEVREIVPVPGPLDAVVRPPGSKSVTNRALVAAALARGTSNLVGTLDADDTAAMLDCLRGLGIPIGDGSDGPDGSIRVVGCGGRPPLDGAILDARLSGTTSRFIAPVAALARGTVVLDGADPLRRRPMAALFDALEALGAGIEPLGEPGHLPVRITGSPRDVLGGSVEVTGNVSSQFLSALLLSGPCFDDGLTVGVTTDLVSVPYVQLTLDVMAAFGATVDHDDGWRTITVSPGGYRAVDRFDIEPDASAASYWAAAAVIAGGSVRIDGLGRSSRQGDVAFIDVLASMGAEVTWSDHDVVVRGAVASERGPRRPATGVPPALNCRRRGASPRPDWSTRCSRSCCRRVPADTRSRSARRSPCWWRCRCRAAPGWRTRTRSSDTADNRRRRAARSSSSCKTRSRRLTVWRAGWARAGSTTSGTAWSAR
ncbi:MAG: hypothetical protein EKK62_01375 [Acidimicrobiia bacterium]|nr:MAG: hypothetical protein EKK62_01375 [Acidimicrobiia bacterium]